MGGDVLATLKREDHKIHPASCPVSDMECDVDKSLSHERCNRSLVEHGSTIRSLGPSTYHLASAYLGTHNPHDNLLLLITNKPSSIGR